ncbi:MAG: hypothetical protein R3F35_16355 [Myxococcota bacterium]
MTDPAADARDEATAADPLPLLDRPLGRRFLFASLYFAEGAPIGYIWWALPTKLRAAGIPVEDVTAISALVTVPWSLKFLWAPLVDAWQPRRFGLRAWIATAQIAMALALLPLTRLEPASGLGLMIACLLVHAVAAATQDVAIDALAVRHVPSRELGAITGWMQVGMLTGRACFGGLALVVEDWLGAGNVLLAMIALIGLSGSAVWAVAEPAPVRAAADSPFTRFVATARRVFTRRETWLGLLLATLAGAAMESVGIVAGPMLIDVGVSKETVGFFFAGPAVVAMGLGALLGGRRSDARLDRAGITRARSLGEAIVAVAIGVVGLAALIGAEVPTGFAAGLVWLALCYGLFGVYTAAAYALFMERTDPDLGATQFSTFMAGINLCSIVSGFAVGRLAGQWGYATALAAMALVSLAGLPLARAVGWRTPAPRDTGRGAEGAGPP